MRRSRTRSCERVIPLNAHYRFGSAALASYVRLSAGKPCRLTQDPVGFITIVPSDMSRMGKKFGQIFVFYLVMSVLVAYVTGTAFAARHPGMDVFRLSAMVAAMGHGTGVITAAVYFGTPWSNTWRHVLDAVLYGVATGAIFAALWP